MAGFLSAPPRTQVYQVSSVYGALMGSLNFSRVRLWILLQDGDQNQPFARICQNHPETGSPFYTELGPVTELISSPKKLEFTTADGSQYALVEAPCVCGAGATGMAGPVDDRYDIVPVRTDTLSWLVIR